MPDRTPRWLAIGRIAHDRFLRQEDGPVYARLEMALAWVSHEGDVLLNETRRVRVYPLAGGEQLIDFGLTFQPQVEQVTFGQSTFGILAARVAHPLEVMWGGGRILNARGALNEEEVHRQPAEWVRLFGADQPKRNERDCNSWPSGEHPPPPHMARARRWLDVCGAVCAPCQDNTQRRNAEFSISGLCSRR